MSLWCWVSYVKHKVDIGETTREEADSFLQRIAQIDKEQEDLDRKIFEELRENIT